MSGMTRLSRRDLLAGTGTAVLAGVAGCLDGGDDSENDPHWRDELDLPGSLVSALAYVYQHGDSLVLGAGELLRGEGNRLTGPFGDSLASVSVDAYLQYGSDAVDDASAVRVWVGEFELDPALDTTDRSGFAVHKLQRSSEEGDAVGGFPGGEMAVATDGAVLVAGKRDQVTATLDSHEAGAEPYLAANNRFRAVLDELAVADGVAVTNDAEALFETEEVDLESLPTPVGYAVEESQDTIQWQLAAGTTDESVAAKLRRVSSSFTGIEQESFDHRVTDELLIVEAAQTTNSPDDTVPLGVPRFDTYDESTGEVLLRFDRGEPIPVENLTVEIEGEPYEGDWARGAETVGAGSQIAIDADAIEPGDSLGVSFETEEGAGASTTDSGFLRSLPFEFSYDPEVGTATLTYVDGPPLPGERTDLRTGENPLETGEQVRALSDGLRKGETLTLESVDLGTGLLVAYERTDGEIIPITGHTARPPGQFSLKNESGQLVVTRFGRRGGEGGTTDGESDGSGTGASQPPEQEPLPAEHYEVRIDGKPTETQWTDGGETIDPGDTLTVGAVQPGSVASVVWVGETAEFELTSRQMPPSLRIALSYDETEQRLRLVHVGGESVDADTLSVVVDIASSEQQRVRSWDGDTVSPGDELTIENVGQQEIVVVQFQGETIFEAVVAGELAETDEVVLGGD